jgi:hypothetical protein
VRATCVPSGAISSTNVRSSPCSSVNVAYAPPLASASGTGDDSDRVSVGVEKTAPVGPSARRCAVRP